MTPAHVRLAATTLAVLLGAGPLCTGLLGTGLLGASPASASPITAPAATRTVPGDAASVLSTRVYTLPGETGTHAAGEVRNDGNETVAIVPVVTFRAADGSAVASVQATYPAVTDLAVPPGGTAAFDVVTPLTGVAAATATIADASPYLDVPAAGADGRTGYAPQNDALVVSTATLTTGNDGLVTASGTVTNASPRPLTGVVVQVVDRDSVGPLRAVPVAVGALAAGATASWSRPGATGAPASGVVAATASGFERAALRTALTVAFDPAAYNRGRLVVKLTLRAAPGTGVPGRGVGGAVLDVTRRGSVGSAVEVASLRTDRSGDATAVLPLVGGTYYSFAYAGDAAHAPALFPDSVVGTPPTIALTAPVRPRAGRATLVAVTVAGGQAGDRVSVLLHGAGGDTTLASGRLSGTGPGPLKVILRIVLPHPGRVTLLGTVDGSTAHPGAVTGARVVTVTR